MKKIAVVVGASSGIGYEVAQILLTKGYIVINLSRSESKLASIINYRVDVANKKLITTTLNTIIQTYKKIDVFVYSAGFSMAFPFLKTKEIDYRYLFEVNFFGAIYCIKKVLPKMIEEKQGRFIVISSLASDVTMLYDPFYSASKSAINEIIKEINMEVNRDNVYLTSVLPGGVATNFTYKRKQLRDEQQDYHNVVNNLQNIEQEGMTPFLAGSLIVNIIEQRKPKPIEVLGLRNKVMYHMVRMLPENFCSRILAKVLKSPPNQ